MQLVSPMAKTLLAVCRAGGKIVVGVSNPRAVAFDPLWVHHLTQAPKLGLSTHWVGNVAS